MNRFFVLILTTLFLYSCDKTPISDTATNQNKGPFVDDELRDSQGEFIENLPGIAPGLIPSDEYLQDRVSHSNYGYGAASNLSPTISVNHEGGTYNSELEVDINCAKNGDYDCTAIAYSLDGSIPSFEGNYINENTVTVSIGSNGEGTYILKAVGRSATGKIGAIRTYNYRIDNSVPNISFDPIPGEYNQTKTVTVSCTSCQAIKYKINDGGDNIVNGQEITFSLYGHGLYEINVSYKNNSGDWIDINNPETYNINILCNGSEISSTGSWPCTHTCSSDNEFELSSAVLNNSACDCVETHQWNSEQQKCVVKNEIFLLTF